jgi:hypothetical protein
VCRGRVRGRKVASYDESSAIDRVQQSSNASKTFFASAVQTGKATTQEGHVWSESPQGDPPLLCPQHSMVMHRV